MLLISEELTIWVLYELYIQTTVQCQMSDEYSSLKQYAQAEYGSIEYEYAEYEWAEHECVEYEGVEHECAQAKYEISMRKQNTRNETIPSN